jgi:hypothetical protein
MGPATLVSIDGEPLLFDTGRGVVVQAVRAGIPMQTCGMSSSRTTTSTTSATCTTWACRAGLPAGAKP